MTENLLPLYSKLNDQEILEEIRKNCYSIIKFEKTPERCLIAVKQDGLVLKHISKAIQTEELCLKAVRQNGMAIKHVSKRLMSDEILLTAIKSNGKSLGYIPGKYITEKLCLEAVNQNGEALEHVPDIYKNKEVCKIAVKQNGTSLKFIPKKYFTKSLCLMALNQDGLALKFITSEFKSRELCLIALEKNELALEFVPNKFKSKKICEELIKRDWRTFKFVPEKLYTKENLLMIFSKIIQEIADSLGESLYSKFHLTGIAQRIPDNLKDDREIIKLERQLKLRYFKNKFYDKGKNKFITEEYININNESEMKEFKDFKSFYQYLDGDLSYSDLHEYDFNNINLRDFNINSAYISSSVLITQNLYDETFYISNISNKEEKVYVRNSENNELIEAASILHDTEFEQTVSNYTQRIYYISDIHLNHKLLKEFPKHATRQEIITYVSKFVRRMVSTSVNISKFNSDYLLIAGDVSFEYEISKIFYEELIKIWDPEKIIVTLGNHEVWDNSPTGVKKNNEMNLENIIQRYRDLFQNLEINFLHNELFILYKNQRQIISEEQLLKMNENALKEICLKSPFIIFGGLGFSGLNRKFNAGNGIYRDTIRTLEEDLKQTQRFENIYHRLEQAIGESKQVIILSHTPKENWTNKKFNSNWVYVSGHTHFNEYHLDENRTVYSDNQLGYYSSNVGLKYFKMSKIYNVFEYYEDGKYIISKEQYLDFNYGMGIRIQFNRSGGNIYMLKNQGFYCFIYKNPKIKKYYLLEGGKIHVLQHDSIDYYYDRMPVYSKIVNEEFAIFDDFIKSISKYVQKIGGSGTIHGCIVDVDALNHVYVNPYDGSIAPYYATSIVDKYVYRNIGELLLAERKDLYKNYQKLLVDNNCSENKLIIDSKELSTNKVSYVEDTLMYKSSNVMKAIQYLTETNIIRVWNENILNDNNRIEN